MTIKRAKRFVRTALGRVGYTIRHVGRGVHGVDLLHDARTLLEDVAMPVLFDVGANTGQTTMAMLDIFRSCEIRAFEPSPASFESVRRAVGQHEGVIVEPLAMGDCEEKLPFHVTKEHSVNDSLLSPTWDAGGLILPVSVETIDGYCERHGIGSISLLKIDTQGYDLRVLRGARRMLQARRIRLYSCEANLTQMYEGQASLIELLAVADEVGYQLVGFYEQTYINDRLNYLDMLFRAS